MIPTMYTWDKLNYRDMIAALLATKPIHTGEWQAMNVRQSPMHATHELQDVTIYIGQIPSDVRGLQEFLHPDLPWAEEHFQERVSGIPYNPAPSHVRWPYAVRSNSDHTDTTGRFDHTYPERFWPKHAGDCHAGYAYTKDGGVQAVDVHGQGDVDDVCGGRPGIRFHYGDLSDVVDLLVESPLTRQAYLPVWFPEDTGAVDKQRVPCTLGYHFMVRDGRLSCRYYIRSCDVYRHLTNDVYLACRLMQWVVEQVNHRGGWDTPLTTGALIMRISSLHMFAGDVDTMIKRVFGRG